MSRRESPARPREGMALVAVLLALLALLVLCTPFLLAARNASKSSAQLADRVQGRLALDAAERHARARLGASHIARDETPFWDALDELTVSNLFDPEFWDVNDPRGVMWDMQVTDVSGRIDLNSAGPQMIANVLGGTTRLVRPVKDDDKELPVSGTQGFDAQGILFVEGELIAYEQAAGTKFTGLLRGLAAEEDEDGNGLPCGPQQQKGLPAGAPVLDVRAFAPARWRFGGGAFRTFSFLEEIREAARDFGFGLDYDARQLESLEGATTVFAGTGAGPVWQRPVRVRNELEAGIDCGLDVDEIRWFNPGTTVRISDGRTTEYGLVRSLENNQVMLVDAVVNDYFAYAAVVSPLARRPVNLNTAPAEVLQLLFENLQWAGANDRITSREARALTAVVIESRPFEGHQDFLRRVVLPAAGLEPLPEDAPVKPSVFATGGTLIAAYDALALYANALNANDARLAFSTMPFAFTSRDVYDLELRASVNAPSGVERVSGLRRLVERIVPQGELLRVWTRQEDFDEELRLSREAPWWSTGPESTARHDTSVRIGGSPASRMWPHFGTSQGQVYIPGISELPESAENTQPVPQHVFASREDNGWAQLWASRVIEVDELDGHVMHFDHETGDPEGRYLPEETLEFATDDDMLGWTDPADPLMRAFDASFWFKPEALTDGVLLDVGTNSLEADRVTLEIKGQDLVLSVFDAAGDDRQNTPGFEEIGQARFSLQPGDGPGLAPDTWTHVSIDVRGNRPDQMTMLIDGRAHGVRYPGLTRAPGGAPDGSGSIALERGEGFPSGPCVVRMGDELIECTVTGSSLLASFNPQDGFGGRVARDKTTFTGNQPVSVGLLKDTNHGPGASAQLYGYSKELGSNVPSGAGTLGSNLGLFRVGIVEGIGFGSPPYDGGMGEGVNVVPGYDLGSGVDGGVMTNIRIRPADGLNQGDPATFASETFDPNGGFLLMAQQLTTWNGYLGPTGSPPVSAGGYRLSGHEIVEYTSVQGDILVIGRRGNQIPWNNSAAASDRRAFILNWNVTARGVPLESVLGGRIFVIPISVRVTGGGSTFLQPLPNRSEFAQLTPNGPAGTTEWIRYDDIVGNFLVRNDDSWCQQAYTALTPASFSGDNIDDPNNPPAPGSSFAPTAPIAPPPPARLVTAQGTQGSSYWSATLGEMEMEYANGSLPISRAVMEQFQFRGVFGTHCHRHTAGSVDVLPVFRLKHPVGITGQTTPATLRREVDSGLPGRHDAVFLVDGDVQDLGQFGTIHWAHNPLGYQFTTWTWTLAAPLMGVAGASPAVDIHREVFAAGENSVFVALTDAAQVPIAAGALGGCASPTSVEMRCRSRMIKFPSGERPRVVSRATVGQSLQGGNVPSAVLDELVFGTTPFGQGGVAGTSAQGAGMSLLQELPDGAQTFLVQPNEIWVPGGPHVDLSEDFLTDLAPDGGLLRIGEEILAYESVDATSGNFVIPVGGRGLLGTVVQHHGPGEVVYSLDRQDVAILTAGMDTSDSVLPVSTLLGFPQNGGTVLVGDELMHYTRTREGALEMPRLSEEPGRMDGKGPGMFRGRYGTGVQGHAAGAPVILFPFRYWDRWTDRADAPELAYQGFSMHEPAAFWRGVFWDEEAPTFGGASIEVLQRTDPSVPWDADPEDTDGLELYTLGLFEGLPNSIGTQSDRIEWRAFVRYAPNAFDALGGLSHGWKQTPHLRAFGATFLAPYMTLRRIDE